MIIDKEDNEELFNQEIKLTNRRKPIEVEESDRYLVKTFNIFNVFVEVWFDKETNSYFRIVEYFKEGLRYA